MPTSSERTAEVKRDRLSSISAPAGREPKPSLNQQARLSKYTSIVPISNRFAALSQDATETELIDDLCDTAHPDVDRECPKTKRKKTYTHGEQSGLHPELSYSDTSNPHSPSLFVPSKVVGRSVNFLIDTGCTTNLLARHVYRELPASVRSNAQPLPEGHQGTLADGSKIEFDCCLRVSCRIRNLRITETFMVCPIKEDGILGMPFLTDHNCTIQFNRACLSIDGKDIMCTDQYGRSLSEKLHMLKHTDIPPRWYVESTPVVFFPPG